MTATATRENTAQHWEALRMRDQMPDRAPTYGHRMAMLLTALAFCLRQTKGPAAILDIGAGTGAVGRYARQSHAQGHFPPVVYHATEQSAALREVIRHGVSDASVAVWSYGSDGVSKALTLREALGAAQDTFSESYPVVLLSHVLEHVEDYYGLLDEAWSFVQPGGFLVVCVPRDDEHRSHHTTWDWDRLLKVLRQYAGEGAPIGCWECGAWADLFCAVPKPGQASDVQANGVRPTVHADERLQGTRVTAIENHPQRNGKEA